MSIERDDPILDACLEEVLGGLQPPDLSAQILRAMEIRNAQAGHAPATYDHLMPPVDATPSTSAGNSRGHQADGSATSASTNGASTNGASTDGPSTNGASTKGAAANGSASRQSILSDDEPVEIAAGAGMAASVVPASQVVPTEVAEAAAGARRTHHARNWRRSKSNRYWRLLSFPAAAAVAVAIAALGFYLGRISLLKDSPQVAGQPDSTTDSAGSSAKVRSDHRSPSSGGPSQVDSPAPARDENPRTSSQDERVASVIGPFEQAIEQGDSPPAPVFHGTPKVAPERHQIDRPATPLPAIAAASDLEVVALIDQRIADGWKEAGVAPSPLATDGEWCRRVYLRLLGRIPTVDELKRFLDNHSPEKRAQLVDALLNSDVYRDELADNWATIWSNVLIGRTGGTEPDSPVSRVGLRHYLRQSLLDGKPLDQMARELISATGSNRPGAPDFNGAVNFLLGYMEDKATPATSRTAQIFLGTQVQCMQCHNHPFQEGKQEKFWELNAFFRQAQVEHLADRRGGTYARLVNRDFAGESASPNFEEAEIYFEGRNGVLRAAYPQFLDGTSIDRSGFLADVDRRAMLADLVVGSERFSQTLVNRLWAQMFGEGFTRPIDDIGEHNLPTHPVLLERLARELSAGGYDMKRALRQMALSKPFSLSSRIIKGRNDNDAPEKGGTPLFSHYYLRQMEPEQVYESLLVAMNYDGRRGSVDRRAEAQTGGQDGARAEWLGQFSINLDNDECTEATTFTGSIQQSLVMMGGSLTERATSTRQGEFLQRLAAAPIPIGQKLDYLYLAALSRQPTTKERKLATDLRRSHDNNLMPTLEDVWWALLNSNEFILDH